MSSAFLQDINSSIAKVFAQLDTGFFPGWATPLLQKNMPERDFLFEATEIDNCLL